jgi:hypothetical protein
MIFEILDAIRANPGDAVNPKTGFCIFREKAAPVMRAGT